MRQQCERVGEKDERIRSLEREIENLKAKTNENDSIQLRKETEALISTLAQIKGKNTHLEIALPRAALPILLPSICFTIGDSMVKHIDGNKIGRAARGKAISHSYSGATVNQLAKKFDENHAEKEQYNTIILHVGTNDLVREEPKKVAADMENLINKAKAHTNKLAVSGVIKRYDGKVNNHKIDQYNK